MLAVVGLALSTVAVGPTVASRTEAGTPTLRQTLAFQVVQSVEGFGLSLSFSATLTVTAPSLTPGGSTSVTANLSTPSRANLSVTYFGDRSNVSVPPIGALYDQPVPGLTYTYHGVPLQIQLNLSAVVEANATVDGPATGGGPLRWNAPGPRTFLLDVSSAANSSSPVVATIAPIEYAVSLTVDAVGSVPVLGTVSVPLYSGSLGLVSADPDVVALALPIPGPSTAPSVLGSDGATLLLVGVGGAAAVGVVVGWLLRRPR